VSDTGSPEPLVFAYIFYQSSCLGCLSVDYTLAINIIHTLHSVFRHTEDMHLLLWTVLTNVFLDFLHVELVIFFYHSITRAIPSMSSLKLKKCSINIIQTLHSVYIHIDFVHMKNIIVV
jgi:hypothetical protein